MTGADTDACENGETRRTAARPGRYWPAVLVGSTGMLVGWFLPFGTLEDTGSIGAGEEQVVRRFSRTVWFWDLGETIPLLLASVALVVTAWWGRRNPVAAGPVALTLVAALSANTYLAASIANRDWRDTPTPAAAAGSEPTPRCEFAGWGRSYTPAEGSPELLPTYSCALGLEGPMSDLHADEIEAGYRVGGLAGFRTGIGSHLLVTISFLIALGSAWVLLRRRMSRFGAGVVIAVAVGLVVVVGFFDSVSHLR